MQKYILDTSALITYIENEEGVDQIEKLFLEALDEKILLIVSIISLVEVFYTTVQEQGEDTAQDRLQLLKVLPITVREISIKEVEAIGLLKALYKISFADSCIAGLAKIEGAILVHKDPEFEVMTDIKQLSLPYKSKNSK